VRLLVTTPTAVVVDAPRVRHVRAEDETGAFGIQPGHADFVTVLSISVITWRNQSGEPHHVAVRGGVLNVREGALVEVATREAVGEDTLRRLGRAVLARMRAEAASETEARTATTRLQLATIRQLHRYLESGRQTFAAGAPPGLGEGAQSDLPDGEQSP
jgi:F-type H+-transporting ATPase subunit epsilon